jgi:hypothetical protein
MTTMRYMSITQNVCRIANRDSCDSSRANPALPQSPEPYIYTYLESLTSVTFESDSKLHRIDESAFHQSVLTSNIIPKSVEVLCNGCFYNCTSLTSVTFESDSNLQRIEASAFHQNALTSVIVPNSVEILYNECFYNCTLLTSVPVQPGSKLCEVAANTFA